ncbi:hypothetical protein RHCRD62_20382 [Rhodococcus sp. RD6.2]|nr:hypothetical protein RHCRD62_20382 [Rhodococcus sp. RD6.2]
MTDLGLGEGRQDLRLADLGDPLAQCEIPGLPVDLKVQRPGARVTVLRLGHDGERQPRHPGLRHLPERRHLRLVLPLSGREGLIRFLAGRPAPREEGPVDLLVEHRIGQFHHRRSLRTRQRHTEFRVDRVRHLTTGRGVGESHFPRLPPQDLGRLRLPGLRQPRRHPLVVQRPLRIRRSQVRGAVVGDHHPPARGLGGVHHRTILGPPVLVDVVLDVVDVTSRVLDAPRRRGHKPQPPHRHTIAPHVGAKIPPHRAVVQTPHLCPRHRHPLKLGHPPDKIWHPAHGVRATTPVVDDQGFGTVSMATRDRASRMPELGRFPWLVVSSPCWTTLLRSRRSRLRPSTTSGPRRARPVSRPQVWSSTTPLSPRVTCTDSPRTANCRSSGRSPSVRSATNC